MSPISIAILYHGGTKEDDKDTQECVKGIEEALERCGHTVKKLAVTQKNWLKAVHTPGDVVFNLVEDDMWKLYIKVGQRLERMGRAQVGQDRKGFKYVIRKAWVKRRMERLGIQTPRFRIINRRSKIAHVRALHYPLIIKPSRQHAGIGISQHSVVQSQDELEKQVHFLFEEYPGEVIVEEYIDGREIHVTLFGNRTLTVLPYCEIGFSGKFKKNWDVYTYNAKWEKKTWEYRDARAHAPAHVSPKLYAKIKTLATKSFKAFGCRDVARMDIRVDNRERPYVVDVNMNPSLNYYDEEDATLASVYAMKWTYDKFIETIVETTYKRVNGHLPK